MGIKGLSSNRRKTFKSCKSQRWQRMLNAEKKKNLPAESVEIVDLHLFSDEKLKHKLRNPKNNIKISGKKRRRLTKRLGHAIREKSQMETEVIDTRSGKSKNVLQQQDEEMILAASSSEVLQPHSPVLSIAHSSTKKRKTRGKKKSKAQDTTEKEESLFTNDNAWEDVEMDDA